ncbi:hypothetical protein [Paraburkholderia hospita]|uniref:hypothetical protein n=1 Tax=Paraburkholderia hospita TaxID=169430 RepID=UPI000B343C14|nr:hypothetical protein [Paraburkholderia hospita]OUL90523.1 hypothetical protein CA603_17225 [Paraburkholderia hospita]
MKEHLSIDEKLDTLRQVVRDYVTHNFMKQDRVIELIDELEDDIKREVADAASDAAPLRRQQMRNVPLSPRRWEACASASA